MSNNVKIKHFDKDFCPMVVPVLEGIEHIEHMNKSSFPVHVAPYVDGVHLIFRHGIVHFRDNGVIIRNVFLNECFRSLLNISAKMHFTIHCTLKSSTMDNESIISALGNMTGMLPNDLHGYITDMVFDIFAGKMRAIARVANLSLISRYVTDKHIDILKPVEVNSLKELHQLAEAYSSVNRHYAGITLFKATEVYQQGFVKVEEASVVSITFKKKFSYHIVGMDTETITYRGAQIEVATALILHSSGNDVVKLDITGTYNAMFRSLLALNKLNYMSREVVFEGVELPSYTSPKYRTLIEIK